MAVILELQCAVPSFIVYSIGYPKNENTIIVWKNPFRTNQGKWFYCAEIPLVKVIFKFKNKFTFAFPVVP